MWWVVLGVHVDVHGEWVMLWVAAMYNVLAVLSMADMVGLSCLYAETVESMSLEARAKPQASSLKHMGFMRFAHFVWAIGFTKNLVDCHHKGHIVRHHYNNSLTVSSCNLNWFDTTV